MISPYYTSSNLRDMSISPEPELNDNQHGDEDNHDIIEESVSVMSRRPDVDETRRKRSSTKSKFPIKVRNSFLTMLCIFPCYFISILLLSNHPPIISNKVDGATEWKRSQIQP